MNFEKKGGEGDEEEIQEFGDRKREGITRGDVEVYIQLRAARERKLESEN